MDILDRAPIHYVPVEAGRNYMTVSDKQIEGLVRAVRGEPRAAQPWWALLQFAERCEVPHTGYRDGLLKLYETATKTAPKAFADNNVSSAFVTRIMPK